MGYTGLGNSKRTGRLTCHYTLETGDINRFAKAGNYASYCRAATSRRESNGKKKGIGNRKNGNKYLGWAFVEATLLLIDYEIRKGAPKCTLMC